ncbi:hypothetical protein BH23BAC3_BH23BAC3_02290 [soil metagenome]
MKLKINRTLSILTITTGVALMIYMNIVEDEPGAIPSGMIVVGTVWFFITRSQIRALNS